MKLNQKNRPILMHWLEYIDNYIKTNMMNKRFIILSFLISLVTFQVKAYDFYVSNTDGVRIYYDFQSGSGNKVIVVEGSQMYKGIVNIPDSVLYDGTVYAVETIGMRAFAFCSQLTGVTMPPKLKTIRESAFAQCPKLTDIVLPDELTEIRERAFEQCIALETVSFGSNLTTIGQYAFYGCTALESLDLGSKVAEIEYAAFCICSSLKKSPYRKALQKSVM